MMSRVSPRLITLDASHNFRHMGGYGAAGGRITRADRLYRSDWLKLSTNEDAARFRALGIRQIFDFRTHGERERMPLVVPDDPALQIHSIPIESGSMRGYLAQIAEMPPQSIDCKSAMTRMYYEMLDTAGPQLRRYFSALYSADGPAMAMCATGKDRTGLASALLLTALGVSPEDVMADYLISATVYRGREDEFAERHGYHLTGHGIERFRDVFTVHPEYLEALWRRAREAAGSLETFIARELLEPGADKHLRERFTGQS